MGQNTQEEKKKNEEQTTTKKKPLSPDHQIEKQIQTQNMQNTKKRTYPTQLEEKNHKCNHKKKTTPQDNKYKTKTKEKRRRKDKFTSIKPQTKHTLDRMPATKKNKPKKTNQKINKY